MPPRWDIPLTSLRFAESGPLGLAVRALAAVSVIMKWRGKAGTATVIRSLMPACELMAIQIPGRRLTLSSFRLISCSQQILEHRCLWLSHSGPRVTRNVFAPTTPEASAAALRLAPGLQVATEGGR